MTVIVITAPAETPITLEEAKAQLRITGTEDDDYIEALIEAVTATIDGPAGWLGRALVTQTLEYQFGCFPTCDIQLPCRPVVSITSIKYDDSAAEEQTLDAASYRLVAPNIVGLVSGSTWPTALDQAGAVRVRYVAGYGSAATVPAPIKQAIKLGVRHLYSLGERSLFVAGKKIEGVSDTKWVVSDVASKVIQDATNSLLYTYRVF